MSDMTGATIHATAFDGRCRFRVLSTETGLGQVIKLGASAMHAENETTGSIHCEKSDDKITSMEVLIIGFGFSAIPLIRELERDGINYAVVSNGEGSIWDRLEKHGRLDFDLVSSVHSSLYSFELVNRDAKDRYPTSKEYLAFIRKYLTQYSSKVIKDWVTSVENHSTHSIVRTQNGRIFETKHLVISTAFKRKMNQLLNEFDYASAKNKTIAITAMGDSVNLMISKLIPYNNRIVLVTNGFMLLDKLVFYHDSTVTVDQFEYHNIRHLSSVLYRKTIWTGLEFVVMCQKLFKFLAIENVYFKHPLAIRSSSNLKMIFNPKMIFNYFFRSSVPYGVIAIKYWPIDSYQRLFDNDSLKKFIRDGYLLNDIAFFLEQGLVELWPKQETVIDREEHTIRWKDNVIKYDYIVDADYEIPNLPDIIVDRDGVPKHKYEYICRNNFMGVIPKELNNIYFIGYTRPSTGGLNNIIEMQCLFTHKLITASSFHQEIHENLEQRIQKYNNYYYLLDTKGHADHLVHYGFYADDVARLMKINLRLSDCRSIRDLVIHFIFPNAAFKYRQSGPYKVEGVKEMVQQIYNNHMRFLGVIHYLLTYSLLQLTAYVVLIVAYYRQELPGVAVPFLAVFVLLNPITPFVAAYAIPCNLYLNVFMAVALALTAYYKNPIIPIVSLFVVFALTYVFRQLGWTRAPFNDLKNKKRPKYGEFFKRYCNAFKEVFLEIDSSTQSRSARGID